MNTNIEASNASKTVITTTLPPFFFKVSNRKNSPVLKAINAKDTSARKLVLVTKFVGIRFRQYGPISIPATI